MPELPDVEMARRLLEQLMRGATITRAESSDRVVTRPQSPGTLSRILVGHSVRAVERRGKWLRLSLDDGRRLFSHLGMTGDFTGADVDAPAQRFERARFDVKKGAHSGSIRYLDARRFGRLLAARDDIPEWSELGPDPLSDGLDAALLTNALARSRRPVKDALMDQTVLAGIGNILATEGLWHARLDPRSRSDRLTPRDASAIVRGLRTAIGRQMKAREKTAQGSEPRETFAAYGREGEPCRRCRRPLRRIVLGGRTTTFCAHCQARRGTGSR
jgi:formamidopyrimidine-DNA glycosylase